MTEPTPRTYSAADVVSFRKTGERFGGLSNMAPGYPLDIDGVPVRTAEALYQACRYPHLPGVQRAILAEVSPMAAKMRAKPHHPDTRPDWDQVRIPVMKWTLRVKLAQHPRRFGDLLRETGDHPIVEDSRRDDFWGALRRPDGRLAGRNVLGRLLMDLRARLRDGSEPAPSLAPVPIARFCLFDHPIGSIAAAPDAAWYDQPPTQDEAALVHIHR